MSIRNIRVLLVVVLTAAVFACGSAEKTPENTTPAPQAPDNTAVNERDKAGDTTTPPDQGENESDLAISAKIRQAVVDDKALSVNAHNVKIVTHMGLVTLRGPVKSEAEKQSIEAKAKQVAGVTKVENLIEIEQQTK